MCGLADVSPAKFGQVANLVTNASHYGEYTRVNQFLSVTVNGNVGSGIQIGGGVDTGRTVADRCFVVDSPEELLYCRVVTPFKAQTDIKVFGSVPFPADIVVSGSLLNQSGPVILADYNARNAEIALSLGRNLASCGTAVVCTTAATVPLIAPQTQWEGRSTQLNLRASKILKLGAKACKPMSTCTMR